MSEDSRFPLSFAQQRLWFLSKLRGRSSEYNLPFGLWLEGELDAARLYRALQGIAARHESLRTRFDEIDGEAVRRVAEALPLGMPVIDLGRLHPQAQAEGLRSARRLEGHLPFDLSRGPLWRVRLVRCSEERHALLHTAHHIVSDGWSAGVFHRELFKLYDAELRGESEPLPPLTMQYGDFTLWERKRLAEGAFDAGLRYWRGQLEGLPERLDLPADRRRDELRTFEAAVVESTLAPELATALRELSGEHQATLFMTLLAALGTLLWRTTGQEDFAVGSATANRERKELEPLIGLFVNLFVTRIRISPGASFLSLLEQVADSTWGAYQ